MFLITNEFRLFSIIVIISTAIFLPACANKISKNTLTRVSTIDADASETAIAADNDGNVFVVYVEHGADKSADFYLQKIDRNAKISGEKVRINPEKSQGKAWRGDPPTIKIGKNNEIFVGWTAKVEMSDKAGANVLNLSVSRDGGKTFDAPVKVNDDSAPSSHGMHSLAIGVDGNVFVAWLDERNIKTAAHAKNTDGDIFVESSAKQASDDFRYIKVHHNSNQNETNKTDENNSAHNSANHNTAMKNEAAEPNSEVYFAFSSDGGKTFSPNKKIAADACPCCKTALLAAPDGRIYASWRQVLPGEFRHIAVTSSQNNGADFDTPIIVSDDRWQISACPVSGAPMIFDAENNLQIFWYSEGAKGKPGLYGTVSKDKGKTFAERRLINENAASGTPSLAVNTGKNIKVVWASNENVYTSDASADLSESIKTEEIGGGKLPATVIVGSKLFTVFVKKEESKQSVWLSVSN
jgi:hypothetical protein